MYNTGLEVNGLKLSFKNNKENNVVSLNYVTNADFILDSLNRLLDIAQLHTYIAKKDNNELIQKRMSKVTEKLVAIKMYLSYEL